MRKITFKLLTPIVKGKTSIAQLELCEPRVSHFKGLDLSAIIRGCHEGWLKLLPLLCPEVLGLEELIAPFDLFRLIEQCGGLFFLPENAEKKLQAESYQPVLTKA
jgi:hypothetical protein